MHVNFISVPFSGAVTFSKVVCLAWLFNIHGTMCYQVLNVLYHLDVLRYYYHSHVGFYNLPLTKVDFSFLYLNFFETQLSFVFVRNLGSKSQKPSLYLLK